MNKSLLTIGVGALAGLCGGSLGLSGIELMLPGLLVLGIVNDYKTAAGTVLFAILFPLSIGAVYVYYKRKQVEFKTSIILIFAYAIAAYFGAKFTKNIDNSKLSLAAGIYLIFIGLFMIWNSHAKKFGKH